METALEWQKANHEEFGRLVRIGYLPAVKAYNAYIDAKNARAMADRQEFERKRDYWLQVLNDFVVAEMDIDFRRELASRHDYKASDYQ